MNSEELFEQAKHYIPGGVHSPVRSFKGLHCSPRFMKSAQGAFIVDEEGKDYIDFCMSFGPLILGHKNEQVAAQVKEAIDRGWSYGAAEKYSLELARHIVDRIDFIDQIRFVNSGTEAVMTAIRLARGYTGKSKILKFDGCYHGHMDQMLIKAGSGLAGQAQTSSQGVPESVASDTLVCELGDLDVVETILKRHQGEVAAVFIEPLPANNGLLPQTQEYLEGLRQLCDRHECLLVFDEVISGFRASFGGMAQLTGVTPDIVTYGKVIGGGFPVGAVAARKEIMSLLAPVGSVYQAGTLSANPVAMSAGLATLKMLTPEFYRQLHDQTQAVVNTFKKWLASKSAQWGEIDIVCQHSLFWFTPKSDSPVNKASSIPHNLIERFNLLFKECLNRGVYLSPNGYEIGFVSIAHGEKVRAELEARLWS